MQMHLGVKRFIKTTIVQYCDGSSAILLVSFLYKTLCYCEYVVPLVTSVVFVGSAKKRKDYGQCRPLKVAPMTLRRPQSVAGPKSESVPPSLLLNN